MGNLNLACWVKNLADISNIFSPEIIIGFLIKVQVQGQHPHQWAPFQVAGLLHTWQISHQISRYIYHELSAIPLCQLLPCHLGPPRPMLSINLYVKSCLDCTIGAFHMSIPVEPSFFRMQPRFSMPSHASSSLDLVVTMSWGLTLQICLICLIIALSFCCRRWRFGFVNGQVSLVWSIALRTQELYKWPRVLKEAGREN